MILFILNECPYQAAWFKPYLKMWGSERDWERIWMVTRPRNNHTIHHNLHKKTFFFQAKNLRKNLRLREKYNFVTLSFGDRYKISYFPKNVNYPLKG